MEPMSHKERLRAALAGKPVDRAPVALWGHDFAREFSAEGLAEATIESYRAYDWDLVKVNPRFTYYWEALGIPFEFNGTTHPRRLDTTQRTVADLAAVPMIGPGAPAFAEQLHALGRVVLALGGEVDVIQTVFNPLTVASGYLGMPPAEFRAAVAADPASAHLGLSRIAESLADYSAASIDAGASGIFFATVDWGTRDAADETFYREFGRPYDLRVLAEVRGAPVNVLHVCRDRNLLDLVLDYPVAAFNWDAHGEGNASLSDVASRVGVAVMGGIDRRLLKSGSAAEVTTQVSKDLAAVTASRFILAGGCSVDPAAPAENLRAALAAAGR
jgi:uroporphyrinogen decarboxylase